LHEKSHLPIKKGLDVPFPGPVHARKPGNGQYSARNAPVMRTWMQWVE